MIRFGIIGIGGFASNHWRALEEIQRSGACEIVAAAVIDPENHTARLEELRTAGVEIFNDAFEMFESMAGKMDAVTIPTPIHTHAELTIAAVSSGLHVFLEKPPTATIQQLDEMIAAVRSSGKICAVGFQQLWSQSMSLLKYRICEGALGDIKRISCSAGWIRKDEYYNRSNWAGKSILGDKWVLDGPINNPLSHQIANMLYLADTQRHKMATPTSVRAELYRAHEIQGEDTASLKIVTAGGVECTFAATLCADDQFQPEIIVQGTTATACRCDGSLAIRYADDRTETPAVDDQQQDIWKFENFISAAEAGDGSILRCSLEMCRPFTLAVNGAYESARSVVAIAPQYIAHSGQGPARKTMIDGIDTLVAHAAARGQLFSDMKVPWAKATAEFDLSGYDKFPRLFKPAAPPATDSEGELFS